MLIPYRMRLMNLHVKNDNEKRGDRFDIVNYMLEECILAYPVSSFIISLYKQYTTRGSLSKKQLQGLYGKANAIEGIHAGKLATLEALINRMPTRYKSVLPDKPVAGKNENEDLKKVEKILAAFPAHKGALVLYSKLKAGGALSAREATDLARFSSLIIS